ncbi:MAG: TolC family protein [Bacteroidota bacterium]
MRLRLLFCLLIPILTCHVSIAQKQWTLQECIEHARSNNIAVRQAEISSEISLVNRNQSMTSMLPSLNASGSHQRSLGRTVDPFTNTPTENETRTTNFSVNSNFLLFNGLRLQHQLAQSKYEYLQSRENLNKIRNDISLNVAAAYLQVLFASESQKTASDRVEAALETRNRTQKMVETGLMAQGTLLDADAALASEELAKVNADNTLQSAYISLTQLLDIDSINGFSIAQQQVDLPTLNTALLSPDEITRVAMASLPEVKASAMGIEGARKGVSSARSSLTPTVSIFSSIGSFYNEGGFSSLLGEIPFNEQVENNQSKNIGLSLSIPIFNGWSARSNIARSKLNLENAMLQDENTKKQVYKSVVQAHSDATAAINRFNAAQKAFSSAKESYGYAEKKYEVGLISFLDFINIRNNRSRAESEVLQAKYDLVFRLKVIDFYLGKPLVF